MKNLTLTLLLIFSICTFHHTAAQRRAVELPAFSELNYGLPGKLYLRQGTQHIEVECSDEVFEKIDFKISGNKLSIEPQNNWGWSGIGRSDVIFYVTMEQIEGLSLSGSGELVGEQSIETTDLKLRLSGSGNMDLETSSKYVSTDISGSGRIELRGTADNLNARISGSGSIKAEDLTVDSAEVSISGSGSIYVTASKEITSHISGSGNVYYSGNPENVNSHSSGSGKTKRMN